MSTAITRGKYDNTVIVLGIDKEGEVTINDLVGNWRGAALSKIKKPKSIMDMF